MLSGLFVCLCLSIRVSMQFSKVAWTLDENIVDFFFAKTAKLFEFMMVWLSIIVNNSLLSKWCGMAWHTSYLYRRH